MAASPAPSDPETDFVRPEQTEGGAYLGKFSPKAIVALEIIANLADQDVDGVVLQLGHTHDVGKSPEVHQIGPRHGISSTAWTECSMCRENSIAVQTFQKMSQCGGGDRGQRQNFGFTIASVFGQLCATEGGLSDKETAVDEDVLLAAGDLDLHGSRKGPEMVNKSQPPADSIADEHIRQDLGSSEMFGLPKSGDDLLHFIPEALVDCLEVVLVILAGRGNFTLATSTSGLLLRRSRELG